MLVVDLTKRVTKRFWGTHQSILTSIWLSKNMITSPVEFLQPSNRALISPALCFTRISLINPLGNFLLMYSSSPSFSSSEKKKEKPRQAKRCLRVSAKHTDSDSSNACAKPHSGICSPLIYSRTSLSRTRLFRITAYLEVKIWSLF